MTWCAGGGGGGGGGGDVKHDNYSSPPAPLPALEGQTTVSSFFFWLTSVT